MQLQKLIDFLSGNTGIHICIHDTSGILERFCIDVKNKIHSSCFCDIAKKTEKGFNLCIKCKTLANRKAADEKQPFWGECPYGLFEAVRPVVLGGSTQCIIYVGNTVRNRAYAEEKIKSICRLTRACPEQLISQLESCYLSENVSYLDQIAEIIESFISLSSECGRYEKTYTGSCRWIIGNALEYARINFDRPLTLKTLSTLYFINEKYLGRMIKKELGKSFHEYINQIRLEHAARLLERGSGTILETALDCGYDNVTYFNRLFKEKYNMTPSEYKKRHAGSPA